MNQKAGEPAGGCGGVGPGHPRQHAHPLRQDAVPGQLERDFAGSFFASNYRQVKNQINHYCGSGIFLSLIPIFFPFPEAGSLISDSKSNKQQSKQKVAINFLKIGKTI
jgi:hypothetical protein